MMKRKDQVVWKALEEKGLLLDLNRGTCFEVNTLGLTLWKLLDGKKTAEKLILSASRGLAMPPERIRKDVCAFLNDLKRHKLVKIV